jgi:hypothetical protein
LGQFRALRDRYATLFFALDPNFDFTRLTARLDVNDARATAHRAIFGVRLPLATAEIDRELIGLPTKRACHVG